MRNAKITCSFILLFVVAVACQDDCNKPPPKVAPGMCCNLPKWSIAESSKKCLTSSTVEPICFSECIFKENSLTPSGQMNLDNVKKLFSEELKNDPDYIPIALKAFEICFRLVKQTLAGLPEKVMGCDAFGAIMVTCINRQVFANCPANKVKTGELCEAARAFAGKCSMPYH